MGLTLQLVAQRVSAIDGTVDALAAMLTMMLDLVDQARRSPGILSDAMASHCAATLAEPILAVVQ